MSQGISMERYDLTYFVWSVCVQVCAAWHDRSQVICMYSSDITYVIFFVCNAPSITWHYMSNNKSNLHSFQSRCLYVKLFSPSTTHKKESLTKRHGPGRQSTCVCQIIRGWMFCENKGTRQFLYVKLFEGRVVPNLHRTQESVAVCCSVLQCIAVCCSALQCAVC